MYAQQPNMQYSSLQQAVYRAVWSEGGAQEFQNRLYTAHNTTISINPTSNYYAA